MELILNWDLLRTQKIFLATPMYGGQCAGVYTRSVMDLTALCKQQGIGLQTYFLFNESLITRARAYCCDEFMRSDCTHLMFIDSDISFKPIDVIALLALATQENNEYDVIAGPYPKKCISWEKIKVAVEKGFANENPNNLENFVGDYVFNPKARKDIPIGEPAEVLEAGTGFMMIKRSAFELYAKGFPSKMYRPDHVRTEAFDGHRPIMMYFDCCIDRGYDDQEVHDLINGLADGSITDFTKVKAIADDFVLRSKTASHRYLSEDYQFCYNIQKLGGKVWLCPWMELQHFGSYMFGGSLAALAAIQVSATADVNALRKTKSQQHPQVVLDDAVEIEAIAVQLPSESAVAVPLLPTPKKKKKPKAS